MSVLSVRLSESLHKMAKHVAVKDYVSLNQFIATAVAEKVAALTTENYLKSRALHGSREAFDQALAKVPAVQPENLVHPGCPWVAEAGYRSSPPQWK
jgi:hypothetical protein